MHLPTCPPSPATVPPESLWKVFRRRSQALGIRGAWAELCPACVARARLGYAMAFRRRAMVLSTMLVGFAMLDAHARAKDGMSVLATAIGWTVCLLLATVPVWIRSRQLQQASAIETPRTV